MPGDHIALYPSNRKDLVDVILSRIATEISFDQIFQVEILEETSKFNLID